MFPNGTYILPPVTPQSMTSMDMCRYNPCIEYTTCRNCTEGDCIWCQNEARCVDKNAYPASFPYGQCREWTTMETKCRPTETGKDWCNFYSSCEICRSDPGCGWCDDGSGTGKGVCLPGGARGPSSKSLETCPFEHWYFTKCPSKRVFLIDCIHFFVYLQSNIVSFIWFSLSSQPVNATGTVSVFQIAASVFNRVGT